MKVIVLSKVDYKEKNCIYDAISETGSLSFQARGAQESKSQFVWLNNPLTVADIELVEDGRYKYKMLKNAAPVSAAITGSDSLDYLCSVQVLIDITKNVLSDEERHGVFNELLLAISALKANKDHLIVLSVFLACALKKSGIELEVDKCVFCGSTSDIVAFSLSDGGFVCRNCMNEDIVQDLSPSQLKLVRYVFRAPDFSCMKTEGFSEEDKKAVIRKLVSFVDEFTGVNLKTFNYFIK